LEVDSFLGKRLLRDGKAFHLGATALARILIHFLPPHAPELPREEVDDDVGFFRRHFVDESNEGVAWAFTLSDAPVTDDGDIIDEALGMALFGGIPLWVLVAVPGALEFHPVEVILV